MSISFHNFYDTSLKIYIFSKHDHNNFPRNIRIEIAHNIFCRLPSTVTFFRYFLQRFWFTHSVLKLLLSHKQKNDPIFQSSSDTLLFSFEFLFLENNGNKELHYEYFCLAYEDENYILHNEMHFFIFLRHKSANEKIII